MLADPRGLAALNQTTTSGEDERVVEGKSVKTPTVEVGGQLRPPQYVRERRRSTSSISPTHHGFMYSVCDTVSCRSLIPQPVSAKRKGKSSYQHGTGDAWL